MQTGTIAKITEKGFGFIAIPGQEKNLFFHSNECNGAFDSFKEGNTVTFEIAEGPKGPNAIKVALVNA